MSETEWVMPTHIVAVAGVVENQNGEILLVKTPKQGWVFPGGQVEVGENLMDAVAREIWEESGIRIQVGQLFCVSSNTAKYPGYNGVKEIPTKVMLDFICSYVGGELRCSNETSNSGWFTTDEAVKMISFPAVSQRFQAYLDYKGRPTYMEYITRPEFSLRLKTTL